MAWSTSKIKKLKDLEAAINPSIQKAIQKNDAVLIFEQTEEQFNRGEDANGMQFVPSYADSTIAYKKRKGQPTNRVTLKDEGDLYQSIQIEANSTQAIISAEIDYFFPLVSHYENNQILGIQPKAMRSFLIQYMYPILEKNWKDILRK
jgi:phage gpG-like protein